MSCWVLAGACGDVYISRDRRRRPSPSKLQLSRKMRLAMTAMEVMNTNSNILATFQVMDLPSRRRRRLRGWARKSISSWTQMMAATRHGSRSTPAVDSLCCSTSSSSPTPATATASSPDPPRWATHVRAFTHVPTNSGRAPRVFTGLYDPRKPSTCPRVCSNQPRSATVAFLNHPPSGSLFLSIYRVADTTISFCVTSCIATP